MPRKKKVEYREQVYDIGDDATVTVRYAVGKRPKMRHDDTVVVVGDHHAAADAGDGNPPWKIGKGPPPPTNRGGNFGFHEDDPSYQDMKKRALALVPAEKPVVTSEQVFAEMGIDLGGQQLNLDALATAAAAQAPVTESVTSVTVE